MQVTFLTHIRQAPGGSIGSIVRLTSPDNAKSSPVRGRTVALHCSRPHDGGLRKAFLGLLLTLVSRGSHAAIALRDRFLASLGV
jgi:hypothetical protein